MSWISRNLCNVSSGERGSFAPKYWQIALTNIKKTEGFRGVRFARKASERKCLQQKCDLAIWSNSAEAPNLLKQIGKLVAGGDLNSRPWGYESLEEPPT